MLWVFVSSRVPRSGPKTLSLTFSRHSDISTVKIQSSWAANASIIRDYKHRKRHKIPMSTQSIQSVRRGAFGTSTQKNTSKPIIDTNLRTRHQRNPTPVIVVSGTYRGCRLLIPTFDASAPVRKGRIAEPA